MLYLTLVVVQVIFRTNQVIVPVTVRAGRDVAACVARLGAQRVCCVQNRKSRAGSLWGFSLATRGCGTDDVMHAMKLADRLRASVGCVSQRYMQGSAWSWCSWEVHGLVGF